jgi:hypothetical protein
MAITAISSSGDTQTELVQYQQKLAADLAAKAAARVLAADKTNVAQAQVALQQAEQAQQQHTRQIQAQELQAEQVQEVRQSTGTGATGLTQSAGAVGGSLDVTV